MTNNNTFHVRAIAVSDATNVVAVVVTHGEKRHVFNYMNDGVYVISRAIACIDGYIAQGVEVAEGAQESIDMVRAAQAIEAEHVKNSRHYRH